MQFSGRMTGKVLFGTTILYAFSLAFSWFPAALTGSALSTYAGSSLWLERLTSRVDPAFIADYLPNSGPFLPALADLAIPLAIAWIAVQVLLSGALMNLFSREDEGIVKPFCEGFFRFGFRYLLLAALSLVVYAVAALLILLPFILASDLLPEFPSEHFTIRFILLKACLVLAAVSFLHAFQYLVRAVMAVRSASFGWSFQRALRSNLKTVFLAWATFLFFTVAGGVVCLLFAWLGSLCYGSKTFLIVFLQFGIVAHMLVRTLLHRSFADLVQREIF